MAPTISRPTMMLTCLLVFIGRGRSRRPLGRCLVARLIRYGAARVSAAAGEFVLAPGLHHDALVLLHLDRKDVKRTRGRAGDDDAALFRVSRTMAGAAEPALHSLEYIVRPPRHCAAQVRTLAPQRQETARRLLAVRRGTRLQIEQEKPPLLDNDRVSPLRRDAIGRHRYRSAECGTGLAQPHKVQR